MNLYLIGPRGAGKSTVAPLVARILGWPLISTDESVEAESGKTIEKIFGEDGIELFRGLETAAIERAARSRSAVVDLGGGAVLLERNRHLIRDSGRAVWLFAPAHILWQRISGDPRSSSTRPPLTGQDGLAEVQQILSERQSVYEACADYEIDTAGLSPDEIAGRIVAWFASVDKCKNRLVPPPSTR